MVNLWTIQPPKFVIFHEAKTFPMIIVSLLLCLFPIRCNFLNKCSLYQGNNQNFENNQDVELFYTIKGSGF